MASPAGVFHLCPPHPTSVKIRLTCIPQNRKNSSSFHFLPLFLPFASTLTVFFFCMSGRARVGVGVFFCSLERTSSRGVLSW